MTTGCYRFDRFLLDAGDRRLLADGEPVEINSRYLDALALLVSEQGRLVGKERFLDEVWRGVPVTDEALTQCIKTLRRQLGDDAARPRFIETVPKHGYRFIAAVEDGVAAAPAQRVPGFSWREFFYLGLAGTLGGGVAGMAGGLIYGFAGASEPLQPGVGAVSILVVILCLTILVALIGAAGVSFGIAAAALAGRSPRLPWTVLGGALGGMVVGAVVKLLGLDAFNLLFGQSPADMTGAGEGALLGAGVGLGIWLAAVRGRGSLVRSIAAAGAAGAAAGILVTLAGGRLMGGSLDLLARSFPNSHLRLDRISAMFGESGLGPVTRYVTGALEGLLFAACIAGAMILARRSFPDRS